MAQYKDVEVGSIVYFWFAANLTTGAAGDGATPLYDVRAAGGAAGDAPTASGTPTLLTHANYTDGLHEIAIDTTGYAAGEYAVFCTLTISTVNPAGFCGSFRVVPVGDSLHSAAARVMDALPAEAVATAANLATVAGYLDTEVAAILAAVDTEVGAIKAKTDNLPTDPADQSAVEAAITAATSGLATAANLATVAGYLDTEIAAILGYVDCLPASWVVPAAAGAQMDLVNAPNATAVTAIQAGLATTTELAKVPKSDGTSSWNATALAALQSEANDALVAWGKTGFALSAAGIDAILVESGIVAGAGLTNDTGTQLTSINARQALAACLSTLAAVLAGAATTTVTTKPAALPAGNTRISATVDSDGNRSAVTLKVPD